MVQRKNKIAFCIFLSFILLMGIFSVFFVLADHIITTSGGATATSFSVNQSSNQIYNVSVNNTDAGQNANITQVNVTLPSGFVFVIGTNGTDNANATRGFSNSSTTALGWVNSTSYVVNGSTRQFFWFNATATSTPGTYNITIMTTNGTGSYSSNLSVQVNDTIAPTITLNYTNLTKYSAIQSMVFNVSVVDAGVASYCSINVNGSTNQTLAVSNGWCNGTYALTGLITGNVTINAYANDTVGNVALNNSYMVWIDTTAPTVNLNYTNATVYQNTQSMIFNVSVADVVAGSSYCSVNVNGGTNQTVAVNSSTGWCNGTYALTGIADGNKTINAYANDTLGNVALNNSYVVWVNTAPVITVQSPTNITYTTNTLWFNATADETISTWIVNYNGTNLTLSSINSNLTVENGLHHLLLYANDSAGNFGLHNSIYFAVWVEDTPAASIGSGGGGTSVWKNTYVQDDQEFSKKVVINNKLGEKERVRLMIDKQTHYFGVTDIEGSLVTIEVSSTPQQKILSVGDEWKVEVTGDDYSDLLIKLNSVFNNKADITTYSINEKKVMENEATPVAEEVTGAGGEPALSPQGGTSFAWLWWILIVVFLFIVGIIIYNQIRKS